MQSRTSVIRELVQKSLYAVDESTVAEAILLRARTKAVVAEPSFRTELCGPRIRSFRPDRNARSFRLTGTARLRRVYH